MITSHVSIRLIIGGLLCSLWLCAGVVCLSEDEDVKSLRVASIETNRFDYIFTSYVSRSDGGWIFLSMTLISELILRM